MRDRAKPVRLQLSRRKGFDLQALSRETNGLEAVKVARPGPWSNPFVIGEPSGCDFEDGGDPTPMIAAMTRKQVVEFYRNAVEGFMKPEMHPHGHRWQADFLKRFRGMSSHDAVRGYLKGRNLACWCPLPEPGQPDHCHAAVLLELANGPACDAPHPATSAGERKEVGG